MSDSLLHRAIRKLREMQAVDGLELAKGGAKDWGDYRFKAGRIQGLAEAERELLELVDPDSRTTIDQR